MGMNSKNKKKATEKVEYSTSETKITTVDHEDVVRHHIRIALVWFVGMVAMVGLFVFSIWLFI